MFWHRVAHWALFLIIVNLFCLISGTLLCVAQTSPFIPGQDLEHYCGQDDEVQLDQVYVTKANSDESRDNLTEKAAIVQDGDPLTASAYDLVSKNNEIIKGVRTSSRISADSASTIFGEAVSMAYSSPRPPPPFFSKDPSSGRGNAVRGNKKK